jgi:hypothetical protein
MLRDLLDRFAYRYQLWAGETQGDKSGAGEAPPEASPRDEPVWRMIFRFLQIVAVGLIFLGVLYRFAMRTFPNSGVGLPILFIILAVIWCGAGLFVTGGELLTKYSRSHDGDKRI